MYLVRKKEDVRITDRPNPFSKYGYKIIEIPEEIKEVLAPLEPGKTYIIKTPKCDKVRWWLRKNCTYFNHKGRTSYVVV